MKKHFICFFVLAIAVAAALSAQSNAFIDKLIDEKEAPYGESVFMALAAAGLVKPDGTVADAMAYLEIAAWGFEKKADEPVTLGDLCYVLMRAYNMNGGFMYALFPGPRYAVREFQFLELVRRRPVPSRRLGGEEVLQIIGKTMSYRGEVAP
ncbi:MAG: hypothetical protein JXD23_03960 [Spirochaetales bacterium]|nr:hypothetical protein [Spirochaetales bacterium]